MKPLDLSAATEFSPHCRVSPASHPGVSTRLLECGPQRAVLDCGNPRVFGRQSTGGVAISPPTLNAIILLSRNILVPHAASEDGCQPSQHELLLAAL